MNDVKLKNNGNVLSSPKARKFARELGINVKDVVGSERLGRVIEKDIKKFISSELNKNKSELNKNKKEKIKLTNEYEYSEFGKVEIKELPRIKIAALHLTNSYNIPHVTNHDEADITEMDDFRNSLKIFILRKKLLL